MYFKKTNMSMVLQKQSIYNVSAVNAAKVLMTYNIGLDGTIQVKTALTNIDSTLPILSRFGTNLIINSNCKSVTWLGRGPHENYQDRNTSALVGQFKAEVPKLYFTYIRPQVNGYKTDTRWVKFTNSNGKGIQITAEKYIGFSANHQYNSDFDAGEKKQQRHTTAIEKRDLVNINIEKAQMGVGGDSSWGAMPHEQYCIQPSDKEYYYVIQP